jgi:hypothetical protein
MVALAIWLIVLCAIAAILFWTIRQFALPQPVSIALVAILAIVCILVLVNFLPSAGLHWPPAGR